MTESTLTIALIALLTFAGFLIAYLLMRRPLAPQDTTAEAVRNLLTAQQETGRRVNEISGAIGQVAQDQQTRYGELAKVLNDRLDSVSQRVGETLTQQGEKTTQSLSQLQERLAVIDVAQKNIVELSGQVVSLQDIFSNKQARGAFGQGQMENIIADTLPAGTYAFNAPLSNGTRPDCTIRLPRSSTAIIIDAKFPRESFEALDGAQSAEAQRAAEARVRAEVRMHVDDIAQKYLIAGETQEPAIMFVPAESIYCRIFADFYDIIQYAQRKHVTIVSPNSLMHAVSIMRGIVRDEKMREQTDLIKREVGQMMGDIRLLSTRTNSLRQHFALAEKDIKEIETSSSRITRRGQRIEAVEIEPGEDESLRAIDVTPEPQLALDAAGRRSNQD
jgi:DNA recombination protein RmuC